jgi:hypothetical protein
MASGQWKHQIAQLAIGYKRTVDGVSSVPAICELDCGVLAVGRCGRCHRAFCGSHRAPGMHVLMARTAEDLAPNFCSGCAEEIRDRRAAGQRRLSAASASARELLPGVKNAFQNAAVSLGWPGAGSYEVRRQVMPGRKRLFGGWSPPVYETDTIPCYVLGTLFWTGPEPDFDHLSETIRISPRGVPGTLRRYAKWDWQRAGQITPLGELPDGCYDKWDDLFVIDRLRELSENHSLGCSIPNLIDGHLQ